MRILRGSCRGSLTLEAAIVLPLYLFFFMALLSVFELLLLSEGLRYELSHAAKEIAVYAPAQALLESGTAATAEQAVSSSGGSAAGGNVSGVAGTVLAQLYTDTLLKERLTANERQQMGVSTDISLLGSRVMAGDDIVDLVATYGVRPRCNVFGIPEQFYVQRARTHAWIGYDITGGAATEEGERIVYVTETGTVYHLSRSCTYLDLTITAIAAGTQGDYRNQSGAKYRVCELCGAPAAGQTTIYITREGDRYHSSLSCSGLKRTVYELPLSQVRNRHACSRCGGAL